MLKFEYIYGAWSKWLDDETGMVLTHAGVQIKLDIHSAQMRT